MSISITRLVSRALGKRPGTPAAGPVESAELRDEKAEITAKLDATFRADHPRVFAVVSWGYAATGWLCKVLDAHPEILAVHGLNYSVGRYASPARPLTACQYLKMVRDLGKGYALAGDVHGINDVSDLPALGREFGEAFRSAVLIRDPERRVLSFAALFEQTGYDERVWTGLEHVRQLPGFPRVAHHYGDKERRFFMHAANMLNKVLEERRHGPVFRSEDLTTDPEALVRLIHHLSDGRISASAEWARATIALPRVNRHTRSGGHDGLRDWQAEIMRALVTPETCRVYEEFGYRLSAGWSTAQK